MIHNIKARLAILGKKSNDIIAELGKRGIKVLPADFSNFINGRIKTPKACKVTDLADQILKQWESKKSGKKN